MWNFSLGAWRLSSGRPKPIITLGIFKRLVDIVDDGNRSAAANEYGLFLESIVQRLGRGFDVRVIGADHAGWAFAPHFNFGFDSLGRELLHEVRVALQDVVGILVGHEAHGDFGRGFRRNHGLGAGGNESSGHAVNFERGARPGAIKN